MKFGPYSRDFSPRLTFESIEIDCEDSVVHLWGPNGSGKSTIMNLILEDLVVSKTPHTYISQNYRANWLWWKSAMDNVLLSLRHSPYAGQDLHTIDLYQRQREWLEPLLFDSKKQVNFATQSELATVQLSGGQLQRVILFRELLHKPEYLLLDESFSALDPEVALQIVDWLLEEQKINGFSILSIAHNREIVHRLGGTVKEFQLDASNNLKIQTYKTKDWI